LTGIMTGQFCHFGKPAARQPLRRVFHVLTRASLVLGLSLALAACDLAIWPRASDLALAPAVAFPPTIPGLPTGSPALNLPVPAWIERGETSVTAITLCRDDTCTRRILAARLVLQGQAARELDALMADPARLARDLTAREARRDRDRRSRTRAPPVIFTGEGGKENGGRGDLARLVLTMQPREQTEVAPPSVTAALIARKVGERRIALLVVGTRRDAVLASVSDAILAGALDE
jgi:hypothetical protein